MVHRAEPIPRALPETVLTVLRLHNKGHSGPVGYIGAGEGFWQRRLLPRRRSEIQYGRIA